MVTTGCSAGVMAWKVSNTGMCDKIFSVCNSMLPSMTLAGLRIGYATD